PVERGPEAVSYWACMQIVTQNFIQSLDPDGYLASLDGLEQMTKAEFYTHFMASIACLDDREKDSAIQLAKQIRDREEDEIFTRREEIMMNVKAMVKSHNYRMQKDKISEEE
ncbi:MAG: hypothetical protein LUE27_07385, partial [Clostridia bacterium]|nr:hypothetical protein [Clostridia bacterium]